MIANVKTAFDFCHNGFEVVRYNTGEQDLPEDAYQYAKQMGFLAEDQAEPQRKPRKAKAAE